MKGGIEVKLWEDQPGCGSPECEKEHKSRAARCQAGGRREAGTNYGADESHREGKNIMGEMPVEKVKEGRRGLSYFRVRERSKRAAKEVLCGMEGRDGKGR